MIVMNDGDHLTVAHFRSPDGTTRPASSRPYVPSFRGAFSTVSANAVSLRSSAKWVSCTAAFMIRQFP